LNINRSIFIKASLSVSPTDLKADNKTESRKVSSVAEGEKKSKTDEEQPLLERVVFEGEIILVDSPDKLANGLAVLANEPVLGFDTESKPAFQKGESYPPCLLQLSTDSTAVLFRIGSLGLKKLPEELIAILEDKSVKKVGCSVITDVMELIEGQMFSPRGFVEINDIEKELTICGLKSLSVFLFNKRIAKAQARSNWEAETLSEAQINYAAIDAWMGRKIYLELTNRKHEFTEITSQEIHNRELRRKLNKVCPFEDSKTVRIVMSSIYNYFVELKIKKPEGYISQYKLQAIITKQMSDKNISFGRNKAHKVFGTLIDAKSLRISKDQSDKYFLSMRSPSFDEFLTNYYDQVSKIMEMDISEETFPRIVI